MKTFRVQEEFKVIVWTYVNAEDTDEAKRKLENGDCAYEGPDFERPVSEDYRDTYWDTFEEVK